MTDFRLSRDRDSRVRAYNACCQSDPRRVEIIEWLLAATLVTIGAHMLIWPEVVDRSHMPSLTTHVSPLGISAVALWLGIVRLVFCCTRRPNRSTFRARKVLAGLSAVLWGEMVWAFWIRWRGQIPPPGFEMLAIMQLAGEIWLIYRIKKHAEQLRAKGLI